MGDVENRKLLEKTNKTKSWFLRKISKVDEPLKLVRKNREKTQMTNVKNHYRFYRCLKGNNGIL